MFSKISLNVLRRYLITILVVLAALFIGWRLWIHYENDPWTRDGRIKADVVQVAPDVTGQVVKINVKDNQQVNIGDVLFEIDPARFELALRQAKAAEEAAKVTLAQAIRESNRNRELKDLVATEVTEQGQSRVEEARAALLQAVVNRDKAQLDLDRLKNEASSLNERIATLEKEKKKASHLEVYRSAFRSREIRNDDSR